jgi:hypothetical protein
MSANKSLFSKLGYPALLAAYFACVVLAFVFAARFLVNRMNAALDVRTTANGNLELDIADANFATEHLGVSKNPVIIPDVAPVPAPAPIAPTPTPVVPVDETLSIKVLNSTSTPGLASTVKTALTAAHFTNITTGNSSPALKKTEIRLKASLAEKRALIEAAIGTVYDLAEPVVLPETSPTDAVIVLGSGRK